MVGTAGFQLETVKLETVMRARFAEILARVVDLIVMSPYDGRQRMLRHDHLRQRIMLEHRGQLAGMVEMPVRQQHKVRAVHPFAAGQIGRRILVLVMLIIRVVKIRIHDDRFAVGKHKFIEVHAAPTHLEQHARVIPCFLFQLRTVKHSGYPRHRRFYRRFFLFVLLRHCNLRTHRGNAQRSGRRNLQKFAP